MSGSWTLPTPSPVPPFPNLTEQSGCHQGSLTTPPSFPGVAASSLFTGGRFAIDPELRGAEFERIIQNLDVHFWKAFWNITEIEVLSVSSEPGESPSMLTDGDWLPDSQRSHSRLQQGPKAKDST